MLQLLGKKIGMTHSYKPNGSSVALTILKLHDARILESTNNDNSKRVLIGFEKTENIKNINKSIAGYFNKLKSPIYKKIKLSKTKTNFEATNGEPINLSLIIKEGDKISIQGKSTGKGFAGVMKRWNFSGLEASHGVSISHRSHGSTGQRQDPGKTFKGKKMAGHLGVDNVTIKNLTVEYFDFENSIIGVKGSVPGRNGSEVVIKLNNL